MSDGVVCQNIYVYVRMYVCMYVYNNNNLIIISIVNKNNNNNVLAMSMEWGGVDT